METKRLYNVKWADDDRDYCINIESDMWNKLRLWALENRIKFNVQEKTTYEEESYSEEAMNSNGMDGKPTRRVFSLEMSFDWIGAFFKSITWFNYTRK